MLIWLTLVKIALGGRKIALDDGFEMFCK